jgi:hypothetical protein
MGFMKLTLLLMLTVFISAAAASAQSTPAKPAVPNFDAEIALAKLAMEAHGGAKLRAMKTLVIRGSVDISSGASPQIIPATFVSVFAGPKYVFELNNPLQPIKQIFDGVQTSSSIRGDISLPPLNRLGFPLLPHLGEQGFVVTAIPEGKKKKKGFRMTSPEGYYTDFYLDEKTNQIQGYDSSYDVSGRKVTTSVEIDKLRNVDGVLVPERYVQRFDTDQITFYANFKAKEILVNSPVEDGIFKM